MLYVDGVNPVVQPHLIAWYETIDIEVDLSSSFCPCIYSCVNLYTCIAIGTPLRLLTN
jgi:hypothetical protein